MSAFSHLELLSMSRSGLNYCHETLAPAERLARAWRYASALSFYQGGFSYHFLSRSGTRTLDAQCLHILGHFLPKDPCANCTGAGVECVPICASLPCERCWILYRHTCSMLDLHRWNELFLELCSMAILSFDHPLTPGDLVHLLDLNGSIMPRLFGNPFLPINELSSESAERVLRNYSSVEQLAQLSQEVARESRAPGILEFFNQRTARMLELNHYACVNPASLS
ncbi:hypothetical protein C8R44DRAFT_891898 [Mycena epipterygia]|nr:hypothetical protein C8R44DRAFT_891898 [Mycena epipterygia]